MGDYRRDSVVQRQEPYLDNEACPDQEAPNREVAHNYPPEE